MYFVMFIVMFIRLLIWNNFHSRSLLQNLRALTGLLYYCIRQKTSTLKNWNILNHVSDDSTKVKSINISEFISGPKLKKLSYR